MEERLIEILIRALMLELRLRGVEAERDWYKRKYMRRLELQRESNRRDRAKKAATR